MKEINLTINDRQVKGKEGDTVLQVCQTNGIDLPTLCHLEGLTDVGACRMCVVEIEKERRPIPACTHPARDGLVVKTHTEKLEKYRRLMLELLFTERNHFCFFCADSGECELQAMAYRYQMDHARYPYTFPSLPTDTQNDFLVIDHNRCILCGRCVRVCGEVVGNHTLDFGRRGWRTMVTADLDQPLGQSSCISCGACVQACPTGAIFSKVSAYRGKVTEGKVIPSLCSLCGVGCNIEVLVKDNNIVRINGSDLTGLKGQLCVEGRFRQVYKDVLRVTTPLIKARGGAQKTASWEEALKLIVEKVNEYKSRYGANSIAGFASTLCPSETLESFATLMRSTIGTGYLDTLDGSSYRALSQGINIFAKDGQGLKIESPLESILLADCVLVVGANPLESHPVAGCYMLRARARNKADIIVIDPRQNAFGFRASLWLRHQEGSEEVLLSALADLLSQKSKSAQKLTKAPSLAKVAEATGLDEGQIQRTADLLSRAKNLVVIYGEGILGKKDPKLVAHLLDLAKLASRDGLKVISLKQRGNSRGAWELGIANRDGIDKAKPRLVYILLSDDELETGSWMAQAERADFLVVQASYHSSLTDKADVVLPSPIWAERGGRYVSLDGKASQSQRVLKARPGIRDDLEILAELAKKL